jgi:hypothetical protein
LGVTARARHRPFQAVRRRCDVWEGEGKQISRHTSQQTPFASVRAATPQPGRHPRTPGALRGVASLSNLSCLRAGFYVQCAAQSFHYSHIKFIRISHQSSVLQLSCVGSSLHGPGRGGRHDPAIARGGGLGGAEDGGRVRHVGCLDDADSVSLLLLLVHISTRAPSASVPCCHGPAARTTDSLACCEAKKLKICSRLVCETE